MYNRRRKILKENTLQEGEEEKPEDQLPSPHFSTDESGNSNSLSEDIVELDRPYNRQIDKRQAEAAPEGPLFANTQQTSTNVYQPRPIKRRAKAVGINYKPSQFGFRTKPVNQNSREQGFVDFVYDDDTTKRIPKNVEWHTIPDKVRKQMRDILSESYTQTLTSASETVGNEVLARRIRAEGEKVLKPIALEIDRRVRMTVLPGTFSAELLDPELPTKTAEFNEKINKQLEHAAELTLKVEEQRNRVEEKKQLLEDLRKKNEAVIQRKEEASVLEEVEDPTDYVQMLLRYPSSQKL